MLSTLPLSAEKSSVPELSLANFIVDSKEDFSNAGGFCVRRTSGTTAYFYLNSRLLPPEGTKERHTYIKNQRDLAIQDAINKRGCFGTGASVALLPSSYSRSSSRSSTTKTATASTSTASRPARLAKPSKPLDLSLLEE